MATTEETPVVAVVTEVTEVAEAPQIEQAPEEVSEQKASEEEAPKASASDEAAAAAEEKQARAAADADAPTASPSEEATAAAEEKQATAAADAEATPVQEPEAAGAPADVEPKAMDVEEEVPETVEAAPAVADGEAEASPPVKANAGASAAGSKRKRAGGGREVSLTDMASRIKRLREEATGAEDRVAALVAEKARRLEEIVQEMDAKIGRERAEAESKRTAADKGGQEYIRKQCEAALAALESSVPRKPSNPFFLFSVDARKTGNLPANGKDTVKKIGEMWAALSEADRKNYVDQFQAEMKRYKEWGNSEEGSRNISERNELLRKVKAAGKEELNSALEAVGASPPAAAQQSPAKRTASATAATETPPKQRRVTPPAKAAPAASKTEPALDEKVLAEATSADLVPQLRNLAARPDVLALGKTAQELLDVLKAKGGMVNAAKNALLSA